MKNNGTNALGNSGIWTTYANDGISNASGFGDQVFPHPSLLFVIIHGRLTN